MKKRAKKKRVKKQEKFCPHGISLDTNLQHPCPHCLDCEVMACWAMCRD